MKKDFISIILILLLGYFSVRPLFVSGFFPMHDDTQVGRVVSMGRSLRQGQFPVRWVSDLGYGYGYPIFNFYGPLPYYVGGLFYAAGLSGLAATKIMFALGILLAGISMYFVASRMYGSIGGIISGLFYLYAPYHAVDIYVRGAVGEYWALIFLPLVLWGLWRVRISEKRGKGLIIGSIGLAGTILSHTILGYVTVVFMIVGIFLFGLLQLILRKTNRAMMLYLFLLFIVGLGISAFFWLPAVSEMHFTNVSSQIGGGADYHDHFVCLRQLWDTPWGYGGSAKGCIDGFSFKLGKLHIAAAVLALAVWLWRRKIRTYQSGFIVLCTIFVVTATFLLLKFSLPVWETIPNFAFIQYPWRLIAFVICGLSLLAGGIVLFSRQPVVRWLTALFFIGLLIVTNMNLFTPQYVYGRNPADFESDSELHWRVSKISDEYLPSDFIRPNTPSEVPAVVIPASDRLLVDTKIDTGTYAKYELVAKANTDMVINRTYFPGWVYLLDGVNMPAKIQKGLPHVNVPEGPHTFEIRFADTPVRTVGNIISLITIIILCITYGKKTYA